MHVTKNAVTNLATNDITTTYVIDASEGTLRLTEFEFSVLRSLIPPPSADMPESVVKSIRAGKKIDAIKALRQANGVGLKEAKDAVEKWAEDNGVEWPNFASIY